MKIKKTLLALMIFAATMASCKKENGQCYNCTYGISNGYQKPPDTYCGDISTYRPKDAQGNDVSSYCTPK